MAGRSVCVSAGFVVYWVPVKLNAVVTDRSRSHHGAGGFVQSAICVCMVDCSYVLHQVIYPLEEVTQAAGFHAAGFHAADIAIGWLRALWQNLAASWLLSHWHV